MKIAQLLLASFFLILLISCATESLINDEVTVLQADYRSQGMNSSEEAGLLILQQANCEPCHKQDTTKALTFENITPSLPFKVINEYSTARDLVEAHPADIFTQINLTEQEKTSLVDFLNYLVD